MFKRLFIAGAVGTLLLAAPGASAQSNPNEISTLTTAEPIEVAGVVLQPGTYVFRVVDQADGETYNRNVVQITSEDLKTIYATLAANPRPAKTDPSSTVPLFEYYAASGDRPKALKTWYPAGTRTARDIVYPRKRAMEIATVSHETVPSVPDETKETELRTAVLTPIEPEKLPPPAPPRPVPAEPKPAAVVAEAVPEMPQTASREPMLAGLGLLSLGGALLLRQLARRVA